MRTLTAQQRERRERRFRTVYFVCIFLLLVLSLFLIFLDLANLIDLEDSPYHQIDLAILILFWIDYLARFFLVPHKGNYFKENFIELISILPFSSEFAYLHLFRLLRFFRLIKFAHLPYGWKSSGLFRFLRRTRKRVSFFVNSRGFLIGFECGILLLLTAAYGVRISESIPYFDALQETVYACATLGLKTSPPSAFGKVSVILLLTAAAGLMVWLSAATIAFSRRVRRIRRPVKLACHSDIPPEPEQTNPEL